MPASSRLPVSSRCFWLLPIGYQASPSTAARRIEGALSPPTQIGGCGVCTDFGPHHDVGETRVRAFECGFLSKLLEGADIRRHRAAFANGVSRPHRTPLQPTGADAHDQPPAGSTSIVASVLAASTAGRCGTTSTAVAIDPAGARATKAAAASSRAGMGRRRRTPRLAIG